MPIGRMLLKSISESRKLAELKTDGARLLYTWLIPHLDVNGCYHGNSEVIKGKVFTRLRKSERTIEGYLEDLAETRLIIVYEANGDDFLYVPDFVDKQPKLNPDREATPRIPMPPEQMILAHSGLSQDQLQTSSDTNKVKVNKVNIKLSKVNTVEFESFWKLYFDTAKSQDDYVGSKKEAEKAWDALMRKKEEVKKIARATNGYLDFLKDKRIKDNFSQRMMYASTFLRSERWKEFLNYEYKADL